MLLSKLIILKSVVFKQREESSTWRVKSQVSDV